MARRGIGGLLELLVSFFLFELFESLHLYSDNPAFFHELLDEVAGFLELFLEFNLDELEVCPDYCVSFL
jgi:hypothetical protein